MYPRTEYEMTEQDLKELLEACKPVPCIKIGGFTGFSQQEMANIAWKKLGDKYRFDSMTVKPINGKGQRFFTAVPLETEDQKKERLLKEKEAKRVEEIANLKAEIIDREERLKELEK